MNQINLNIEFVPVKSDMEIENTAYLAKEIWYEYFAELLSLEQIDYMVDKFLSVPALKEQIRQRNYEYYQIMRDGNVLGFTGIHREENALFLSKLYLLKEQRGRGYASRAFEFLENYCKKHGLKKLWLTVNRYNSHTIQVYEKKGLIKACTQVTDIGNGFVMDDYIMEKEIVS